MRSILNVAAAVCALGLSVPAHGQMGMMGHGPGMMGTSMLRHRFLMMHGVDPRYASMTSPLEPSGREIEDGRRLFQQNCARCHGATGLGDGPDGANLSPRPANVAASSKMPMASDGYLFWVIAEGGQPVGSAMPPFKTSLSEDDIWKVISYLRVM